MLETLIRPSDAVMAGTPSVFRGDPQAMIPESHRLRVLTGYECILIEAEAGREERIRLGDIAASQRPSLQVVTDGA